MMKFHIFNTGSYQVAARESSNLHCTSFSKLNLADDAFVDTHYKRLFAFCNYVFVVCCSSFCIVY